jgi:hypothetical protein
MQMSFRTPFHLMFKRSPQAYLRKFIRKQGYYDFYTVSLWHNKTATYIGGDLP